MPFLEARTPDALRELVRSNITAQSLADQLEAECREVRLVCPPGNDFLRDKFAIVVHRALTTMNESHDYEGSAPVLTVRPYGIEHSSNEHTRDGSTSIVYNGPRQCHACTQSFISTVPFWLAVGRHVVQIDLCRLCSVEVIDLGARPQTAPIPDTVPEAWG